MTKAAGILALVLLGGCRLDYIVTLFPDGSGKFTLSVGKREKVSVAPRKALLAEFEGRWGGVVAWEEPVVTSEDGWNTMTLTGYFDRIADFKIWDNEYMASTPVESRNAAVWYEVSGQQLIAHSKTDISVPPGDGKSWEPVGRRALIQITAPGTVTQASGVTFREGRSAGIRIDDALMADLVAGKDEARKKAEESRKKPMVLKWGTPDVSDEEVQAFKKELVQAKERWKVLREEWKNPVPEKK